MKWIGSPPQPVETWLATLAYESEQAADRTGWWQGRKRRWFQAKATAYWLARAYVLEAQGQPHQSALLNALQKGAEWS